MLKKIFKKIIVFILQLEARLVLLKYKPKIVAVTGSVGKTTTKDTIYTVLSSAFFVRKSKKSFNSEIGVPLCILGCQNGGNNPFVWFKIILEGLALVFFRNHYPKWLVLEVGADHPGDISGIAKWLKPDIAVITRFAEVPAHVEYFNSPADVIAEKKQLVKYLKQDGLLILNHDDEAVFAIKEEYNKKTLTYGFNEDANIKGSNVNISYHDKNGNKKIKGITFKVEYGGTCLPVSVNGVLGVQHVYPGLAAIAVGASQGLNLVEMSQAIIGGHSAQPGRMRVINGIKNSIIIDDSYNSSPLAVQWALKTLKDIETDGKKYVVLGDMMELGKYTVDAHKKVGNDVVKICDVLVTVGARARDIAVGAMNAGMHESKIFQFEDSQKAGEFLQNQIQEGDIILVKGSRWATRMERTVEEIMARPEMADELLVR